MNKLSNKTVLITGASSGIGAACAQAFADRGANLILCARRQQRLDELTQRLKTSHVDIHTLKLDVTQASEVNQQLNHLPERWQTIDILLNNAGLAAGLDPVQEGNIDDWERMIDTNIKGLLYVTRAILPNMVKRDSGHIINIGSTAGHEVYPKGAVYCASKHAVNALTRGFKMDLLGSQVRVSSVDPGITQTEFYQVRFHGDQKKADATFTGMTPLSAQDVADAVIYCATRPAHVNISEMIILATDQSSAWSVHRRS